MPELQIDYSLVPEWLARFGRAGEMVLTLPARLECASTASLLGGTWDWGVSRLRGEKSV